MSTQPARWSRVTIVTGVVSVAALTAGALWWWRRRSTAVSSLEQRTDPGVVAARYTGNVDVRHGKLFQNEEVLQGNALGVKYIFQSQLYLVPYGEMPQGLDPHQALVHMGQCGRTSDAADFFLQVYRELLSHPDPNSTWDQDDLDFIEEQALFVHDESTSPDDKATAIEIFNRAITIHDTRTKGAFLRGEGSELALAFSFGIADVEKYALICEQRLQALQAITLRAWTPQELALGYEGVHAAIVENKWLAAQLLAKRMLDAARLLPNEAGRVLTAMILRRCVAPIDLWNGELDSAFEAFDTALRLSPPDRNVIAEKLALVNCWAERDHPDAIRSVLEWIALFNEHDMLIKVGRSESTPATAPTHVPMPIPFMIFRLGQCVRAITLYGPRDPQSGTLLTPRAEFAEAHVTVQFVSRDLATTSPYVYVVGKWYSASNPTDQAIEMYWRVATSDLIHTNVTFTSPPLPGTRAGIHRIHLEFFSDPEARREHRLGVLHQMVWCPMDCAAVTERESRAMWRYAREGDQDAVNRLRARREATAARAQKAASATLLVDAIE